MDKSDSSSSKSNTGSVNSVSNKETDSVCVISADKQLSGQPAMKTKAPSNQPAAEGKVQTNIKMQDVRTREEKLRKREEELKQREAAIRETENRQKHLETYIERVEARNQELEKTIRILRHRLAVYETNEAEQESPPISVHTSTHTGNAKPVGSAQHSSASETLVQQMHEKVSQFVLKKIDNELNLLLNTDSNAHRDITHGNSDIHMPQPEMPPQVPLVPG